MPPREREEGSIARVALEMSVPCVSRETRGAKCINRGERGETGTKFLQLSYLNTSM